MADLDDLKAFGEGIVPVVRDLFERIAKGQKVADSQPAMAAIERLKKLVAQANATTPGGIGPRVAALQAERNALTEMLINAASSNVALRDEDVRTIQLQRNALRNRMGQLIEIEVFTDIAQLLTPADIQQIGANLARAQTEIRQRQDAKQILDVVVQVVITAGSIAAKL
jgi:hypothetical protein